MRLLIVSETIEELDYFDIVECYIEEIDRWLEVAGTNITVEQVIAAINHVYLRFVKVSCFHK